MASPAWHHGLLMGWRRVLAGRVSFVALLLIAACSSPADDRATQTDGQAGIQTDGQAGTQTEGQAGTQTEGSNAEAPVVAEPTSPPGLYVAPGGEDSNDGRTPDTAFASIAHAVKQLTPGDTLWVLDGVYDESERQDSGIVVEASGTADAWIRIAAFPGAEPVIRTVHRNGLKVEGGSYIEIEGLTFEGSVDPSGPAYTGAGINVDGLYGVQVKNHHVRVIGNTIYGFGAGGIPVTGTSHVEIRDNVIFEVAGLEASQHSGISMLEPQNPGFDDDANGYSNYIIGNVVYEVENKVPDGNGSFTDGNCIIMDRTVINEYTGRTLIANNVCVDNGGRGVQVFESSRVDVVHNTLYENLQTGEIAASGGELGAFRSTDVVFANNLVFAADGLSPTRVFNSTDIEFVNNLYVASRPGDYGGNRAEGDLVLNGATDLVVSAGTDPTPGLFDLISGSAAIDAGTDRFEDVLTRDFTGRRRVLGDAPDIGAFEFSG